jgi:predicted  nucleic acid-binding Zn-ribbon protein
MPKKTTAQTGWVIAATEGATVDGRTITKQWIEEMAETYSIEVYTAVIWPEHFRSSWGPFEGKNWGTVDAVKAAKKGGKLRLFVKLTANEYLLEANKEDQKLFMSIEANTDFTGTGKCYLQGLAVTDSPASTGTTRLKFSMGNDEIEHDYSELEELQYSDFIFAHREPNQQAQAKSLITQLINLFSTSPTAEEETNIAEETTMTEEQLAALMGKFTEVTNKIDGIETKFNTLEEKVNTFSASPGETTGDDKDEAEAQKGGGGVKTGADTNVTEEQFTALTTGIESLTEKLGNLETQFNALSKETDNQEPNPAGQGESISLV